MDLPRNKNGDTDLSQLTPHKVIYVSSSKGNDGNNGLSEHTPKQKIISAYNQLQNGYHQGILLKKGDTWIEPLPFWTKSGANLQEPMFVSSYGEGNLPQLRSNGSSSFIRTSNSGGSPKSIDYLVFKDLELYNPFRDPNNSFYSKPIKGNTAISWLMGSKGALFENLLLRYNGHGFVLRDHWGNGLQNITIRRSRIFDCYEIDPAVRVSGLYAYDVNNLLIEENFFDRNGWNPIVPGATRTPYNHNLYIQFYNKNVIFRRNITSRASSHGIHLRSGGLMEENTSIDNPIGLQLGYEKWPDDIGDISGLAINNVITESGDLPSRPLGWGLYACITPTLKNQVSFHLERNLAVHSASNNRNHFGISLGAPKTTHFNNLIWNWNNTSTKNNHPDPNRTIKQYSNSLTTDAFLDGLRQTFHSQSALDLNNYMRSGFLFPEDVKPILATLSDEEHAKIADLVIRRLRERDLNGY